MSLESQQNEIIKKAVLLIGADVGDTMSQAMLSNFGAEWDALATKAADESLSREEQAAARRQMEAIAKGLPGIATGLRDAVKGFQGGDPFAGSAAIMDICSSAASMIGAMSAAGGPPGALVGAVFSIVSMILKMFVKPQTSLSDQLEKVVRGLAAEEKMQRLATAKEAIRAFMTAVARPGTSWTLQEYQAQLNLIDGMAINAIREAAQWLEQPKNQDQPLWGELLAAQCQAYSLAKHSLTVAVAQLDAPPETKMATILKLTALYESNDSAQLEFLRRIRPAAQSRGTIWHIGTSRSYDGWIDIGNLSVRDTAKGSWNNLGGDQRVFTVARRRAAHDSAPTPQPHLAIFCLEYGEQGVRFAERSRKNARAYGMFGQYPLAPSQRDGWHEIPELAGCTDICATPGLNEKEVLVYVARDGRIERWVHGGHWYEKKDAPLVAASGIRFDVPGGGSVDSVSVVADPLFARPSGVERPSERIVLYGKVTAGSKQRIFVDFHQSSSGTIDLPWPDAAIKTDRKYLWIFTPRSIASITHLQAKEAVDSRTNPAWMMYTIPHELGTGRHRNMNFDGLHDLAPCDDGTLVGTFGSFEHPRDPWLYQAAPKIDLAERRLIIGGTRTDAYGRSIETHGWTRIDAEGHRVQKDALYCFTLVEGLERALAASPPAS